MCIRDRPNTKPDARQRWFLKGFFKESDPMLVSFEYLPCRVRFAEDPSELVFDYRLPIRSNIDHILGDEENLTRIPASLMGEGNSLLLRRAFELSLIHIFPQSRSAPSATSSLPREPRLSPITSRVSGSESTQVIMAST